MDYNTYFFEQIYKPISHRYILVTYYVNEPIVGRPYRYGKVFRDERKNLLIHVLHFAAIYENIAPACIPFFCVIYLCTYSNYFCIYHKHNMNYHWQFDITLNNLFTLLGYLTTCIPKNIYVPHPILISLAFFCINSFVKARIPIVLYNIRVFLLVFNLQLLCAFYQPNDKTCTLNINPFLRYCIAHSIHITVILFLLLTKIIYQLNEPKTQCKKHRFSNINISTGMITTILITKKAHGLL